MSQNGLTRYMESCFLSFVRSSFLCFFLSLFPSLCRYVFLFKIKCYSCPEFAEGFLLEDCKIQQLGRDMSAHFQQFDLNRKCSEFHDHLKNFFQFSWCKFIWVYALDLFIISHFYVYSSLYSEYTQSNWRLETGRKLFCQTSVNWIKRI